MKNRFNKFSIIIPVEFDSVFSGLMRENPEDVLRMISRENVVRLASLLKREYCGKPAIKMANLLSTSDAHFMPLYVHLKRHIERIRQEKGAEVVVAFDNCPLEILRIACSIPPAEMKEVSLMRTNELEWRLTKLIAQINQRLMDYTAENTVKKDIAKLLLVNDASYKDIHKTNSKNSFIIQPTQAILFFQLLESNSKYAGLLNAFYKWYGIESWKDYVKTIYSLSLQCFKNGEGTCPSSTVKQNGEFFSSSVLDRLSIDANKDVFPYACEDEYDGVGNSDYKEFKGKPLFKLSNGDYVIYNQAILVDRLFQGLYFDFRHIASSLEEKQPDVTNLFTSDFVEKTLFAGVVKNCVSSCRYLAYNEEDLMGIHKLIQNEIGYPDFFIRSKRKRLVILFECKDIRINAWIKEQRNYDLLEQELRNKIVSKTYQLDMENKCHRNLAKPKRIGIGQLAGHAANIRKGQFPWATDLPKDVIIYPVLVIADNRLIYEGLPLLAQQWYNECLAAEGVVIASQERPLIMMSPLTFIKYKKRFLLHGLDYYFEQYYKAIGIKVQSAADLFNRVMSFDTFMEQYKYSLPQSRKSIMKTIYGR